VEAGVGLFDRDAEEPEAKLRRYILTGIALAALVAIGLWYVLRFHTEKKTAEGFLQALVASDTQQAYRIWKPQPTYSYQDFLEDWGPTGYYGPVKSYRIETAQQPKRASGVIVVVAVSPYESFPEDNETEKHQRTKEVRIWVERKDQSLSFPP